MKQILIFMSCFLLSCSTVKINICNYEDYIIKQDELFMQKNNYYVLVYLDGCTACRDIKLFLTSNCSYIKKEIYYLNFNNTNFFNNPINTSNINIEDENRIYIKTVPHLLEIDNKRIINEWKGYNLIREHFK